MTRHTSAAGAGRAAIADGGGNLWLSREGSHGWGADRDGRSLRFRYTDRLITHGQYRRYKPVTGRCSLSEPDWRPDVGGMAVFG